MATPKLTKLDYTEFGMKPLVTAHFDNGMASICNRHHLGDTILIQTVLEDDVFSMLFTNAEYLALTKKSEFNPDDLETPLEVQ